MSRRSQSGGGEYDVGYCRPPAASRFKPGQSGNPNGRPRARKTVADHIREAMAMKIKVVENGRSRTLSAQEVILRNLVAEAARKNLKAVNMLFALVKRYGTSDDTVLDPGDLPRDDRDILQEFVDQMKSSLDQEVRSGAGRNDTGFHQGDADPSGETIAFNDGDAGDE